MTVSTKEEILSRPLVDILHFDIQTLNATASAYTEFDIKLSIKRKLTNDALVLNGHFIGVTCIGRKPTHFLINFGQTLNNTASSDSLQITESLSFQQQMPMSVVTQSQPPQQQAQKSEPHRGSLHGSIRRGSFDVRSIASENIRRTSLAKLSALPLEAPITKVEIKCLFSYFSLSNVSIYLRLYRY